MTTLAVDTARPYEIGDMNDIPVIANDIIYEGAAVGVVIASGHARPLTSVDRFAGFAEEQVDNTGGLAAALSVRVRQRGQIQLSVTGAVITDKDQPVYATDDNAFTFVPTGAVFVGFVKRFVSAGVVIVAFDVEEYVDPWAGLVCQTLAAATLTLDLEDSGKAIFCTVDTVVTLAATAVAQDVVLVNAGPYGTVQISADPVAADKFVGPNLTGVDNKDYINTKATAQRGDFIAFRGGHTDGPIIYRKRGTWAAEG